MPFDPALPANNSAVSSSELRGQLTSLNSAIGTVASTADDNLNNAVAALDAAIDAARTDMTAALDEAIANQTAGNITGVDELNLTVSNPPTQAEVQAIADKVDELMQKLGRI